MVLRGVAAIALVVLTPLVGALVLFWGAVALTLGGADFDTHIVFPYAGVVGAAIGLGLGLTAAWRVIRGAHHVEGRRSG